MNFDYYIMIAIQEIYNLFGQIGDFFFLTATLFGEKTLIISLIAIIYWCKNKKLGEYIIISMFTSLGINGLIKDFVKRPRPFESKKFSKMRYVKINNGLINTEELVNSYSFPSAHSQSSSNMYSSIALYAKKKIVTAICILIIFLVVISRVYLGVHYPTDVICGALISFLITWLIFKILDKYYEKKILIFLISICISIIPIFFNPSIDTIKVVGFGIGALLGMFLESRYINFDVAKGIKNAIFRLLIGLIIILGTNVTLKLLFPQLMIVNLMRYIILGIETMYIVPLVFKKLKI